MKGSAGLTAEMEDLCGWVGVWGGGGCVERVGCKCVSVYRSPIFGCDISLSKDKVAF